jgi:hypothetical protein
VLSQVAEKVEVGVEVVEYFLFFDGYFELVGVEDLAPVSQVEAATKFPRVILKHLLRHVAADRQHEFLELALVGLEGVLRQLVVAIAGEKALFLLVVQVGEYSPHEVENRNVGYLANQLCFGPGYQGRDPVDVEQDLFVAWMGDCCLFKLAQVEDRVIELLVDLFVDKIANKLIELVLEEDQVEQPPGYLSEGKLRFVLPLLLEFERLGQSLVL